MGKKFESFMDWLKSPGITINNMKIIAGKDAVEALKLKNEQNNKNIQMLNDKSEED